MADDQEKRHDSGSDEDETRPISGAGETAPGSDDETQLISADETVVIPSPKPNVDETRVMEAQTPDPDVWKGRAEVTPPPMRDAIPPDSADVADGGGRTWWTPLLLGMLALGLVGLILVGVWLATRNRGPDPVPSTGVNTQAPATTAVVQPSPVTPTVQLVAVPDLLGKNGLDAATELEQMGLVADIREVVSTKPAGTVVRQDPLPGVQVQAGSIIVLFVAVEPDPTEGPPSPTPPAPSPSPEVSPS